MTTPAERFNAVVAAGRSAAICNYVFDVPTDAAQAAVLRQQAFEGAGRATEARLNEFVSEYDVPV